MTIKGCLLIDEQGEDCVECTDDPSKWCQTCIEVEVARLRAEVEASGATGMAVVVQWMREEADTRSEQNYHESVTLRETANQLDRVGPERITKLLQAYRKDVLNLDAELIGHNRIQQAYQEGQAEGHEQGVAKAEKAVVEMLRREDAKCGEYLSKRGQDQDKRIQQEHYSSSMNWTIRSIEDGDHWDHE